MNRVGILGCGWLGIEVAKRLSEEGKEVNGSTTTSSKLVELESFRINAFLLNVTAEVHDQEWKKFLEVDTLFINLPPSAASSNQQSYAKGFEQLMPIIESSPIKHIVFISSTSVYENNNNWVTETAQLSNDDRAQRLIDAEKVFTKSNQFSTVIIRFAGLFGKSRNPINYLSGKKRQEDGRQPINLIHLVDCVNISILALDYMQNEVFNAVADKHPTKEEFYNEMAKVFNVDAPEFLNNSELNSYTYKIISNEKLKKTFNYSFKFPNPLLFKD